MINWLRTNRADWHKIGLLLPLLLLVQALALGLNPGGMVRAEGFSDPAFQNQWNQTDQAVATGKVSRTYFWGPQPFAHTSEVYAESPNNGQREVQYYDKARMELPKKSNQDPNLVTNGLLTVELVTGQMQVGNTAFLQRSPATNPVAGDQVGNPLTPTYASFNQGKLAFGVPGATKAADRSGQSVTDAVNVAGQVSTISPAVSVKYARYFSETGHNVADVFNNFFQQSPLGEDKWLSVMGYPVTEPFWAKEKVVVGGQSKDVLIQLFQRRALTYTPSNSAAFQVEMGNIGQHYYVWRYGFDTRDQLPGNYRLVQPVGKALFSTNIRRPTDKINLGSAPADISGHWALNEGRAVFTTFDGVYLADLTKARAFKKLAALDSDPASAEAYESAVFAVGSPDGQKVAVIFGGGNYFVVGIYVVSPLSGDNLNIVDSYMVMALAAYSPGTVAFSPDSTRLLVNNTQYGARIFNLANKSLSGSIATGSAYWVGKTNQVLVTVPATFKYDGPSNSNKPDQPGKVILADVNSGTTQTLVQGPFIRQAMPSPDGNYFALRQQNGNDAAADSLLINNSILTFRSMADPNTDLTPVYVQGSIGRSTNEASLVSWSADGTFVQIMSSAGNTGGTGRVDVSLVSLVNGKALKTVMLNTSYMSSFNFGLVGSLYTLNTVHQYNGPDKGATETITLQNIDGSEQTALYSAAAPANTDWSVQFAQVVQVPVVSQ